MMLLFLVMAICTVEISALQLVNMDNFGYYWRDWNTGDDIPEDAVPFGTEKDCGVTFVAKAFDSVFGGYIIPGKFCGDTMKMTYEFNNQERPGKSDVQILCALDQDRLEWADVKQGDRVASVVGDKELIIGGYDLNRPVAIGKYVLDDEVFIGKVLFDTAGGFIYMKYTKNKRSQGVKDGYQMLLYNNERRIIKGILNKCLVH